MLEKNFKDIIRNIKDEIINTEIKTMQEVNSNLIMLYFRLGKIVSENKQYGNNFTKQVSTELKLTFPNMKGFSERNIRAMRMFYEEYAADEKWQQLVAKLPWGHNLLLIEKIKDKEIRKVYAENSIKNGWSRNILSIQIETEFHKRIGNYIEVVFPTMRVSVISANDNTEINCFDYYKDDNFTFKNLFNDMYAKDSSKKVRSSLIVKKNNGEFIGKLAPYGYIKDSKDKHKFLIDKNVSHIIKKIFDMILDGKSRKEIANFLNDNDILTPSEYLNINKNKDEKEKKKWNPEMVNKILRNENYTGTLFQGKKRKLNYRVDKKINIDKENWIVTQNHHEAIISKETFDKVQNILDRKSKVNKDGSIDLLSGILKCKFCGSNMIKRTSKGKVYYYCSNYYRTKNCQNNKSITKSILEEFIKKELNITKIKY